MAAKRPTPVAVCNRCGKASYSATLINQQCVQRINREQCKGIIKSAVGEQDWAECRACAGEGCAECRRVGWLFLRS
jgi:hypothetical protein